MTCYWEVNIDTFTGVSLEIGVATRRSIYRGGHSRDEARCLLDSGRCPFLVVHNWINGYLALLV